ncbi:putative protein tyrosine phosphatase [Diplodia seriata]|uniref:protein-tyrosine-phosphatase n=1 Tax=Diplodia seriata TaxID=420778 RepID=A0A0G2EE76_9PEZI|nr:putative protein tyrosine phosphatase [Diplodia seriata]
MTTSAATPSHTPCAWEHHPHSQQRPTPSRATTARTPASVGQPLPPALRPNDTRSPIAQDARTPSPNYFGLAFDSTADIFSSSGARHAKANWSPPTSNVRSAAAASPRVIPVDQNPEFEAFRRQSEDGRKFSLGGGLSQFTFAKVMVTPQHVVTLLESSEEEILLLDLRVSTQYALSRIRDALNLCIPTTLLKRVSFNVEKLAETFSLEGQRKKFENWRSCRYIVVYDADSSQLKDATSCVNTLKKFANEGWNGPSYIIRGGIKEFSTKFPSFITRGTGPAASSASKKPSLKLDNMPGPAPVVGGCPMPATQNAANPFFGNIRQNMDLIGGVGQMPVKRPQRMNNNTERQLPGWLKHAADEKDKGASVSDKFLQIEKREQKRMQEALSGKVVYGEPGPEAPKSVKIAGIEKGTKNRYNNIWPFEHSRVKLEGVPSEQPYVIVRKFTLSNTELPFARMREITQLQYSNWPDFGAPAHPAHLLGLVEQCDAVVRQTQGGSVDDPDPLNSHPVLVHCSAGCGRTGTFCTVDSVIDMLKRQRSSRSRRQASPMDVDRSSTTKAKDNPFFKSQDAATDEGLDGAWLGRDDIDLIEKTVETFRHQRLSMVQSLRQFVLCYESVLEWLVEQNQDLR